MKWKFMFKFKNNILTLGASDVYIFNNLLRMKAPMSMCVASRLWSPCSRVLCVECLCMGVGLCGCVCVPGGGNNTNMSLEFCREGWVSFCVGKS